MLSNTGGMWDWICYVELAEGHFKVCEQLPRIFRKHSMCYICTDLHRSSWQQSLAKQRVCKCVGYDWLYSKPDTILFLSLPILLALCTSNEVLSEDEVMSRYQWAPVRDRKYVKIKGKYLRVCSFFFVFIVSSIHMYIINWQVPYLYSYFSTLH